MVIHYVIVGSVCALGLSYLAVVHYLWLGNAGGEQLQHRAPPRDPQPDHHTGAAGRFHTVTIVRTGRS